MSDIHLCPTYVRETSWHYLEWYTVTYDRHIISVICLTYTYVRYMSGRISWHYLEWYTVTCDRHSISVICLTYTYVRHMSGRFSWHYLDTPCLTYYRHMLGGGNLHLMSECQDLHQIWFAVFLSMYMFGTYFFPAKLFQIVGNLLLFYMFTSQSLFSSSFMCAPACVTLACMHTPRTW